MRQFLLISLFAILLTDIMIGPGLSLGPGLSIKNAMLYLIFVALVLEFVLSDRDLLRETWPLHTAWTLLAFYATFTWLAIVLLGLHRGYDNVGSFITLKGQIVDLLLFLLVYLYGPRDANKSISVLKWLIGLLVAFNLVTLIDFLNVPDLGIIPDRHDGRITGPVKEVNQYGAILIFMIPITAGLVLGSRGAMKALYAFGTVLAFVLLGLTVSRGSYVGLLVGSLGAMYLVRHHIRKGAVLKGGLIVLVVVLLAGITVAVVNPEGFLGKFQFGESTNANQLSSGRLDVWFRVLTKMSYWPVSFITGYGWNSYRALIGIYGDPHNTYLLYWFNLGLIGLGLYISIVVWTIKYTVSSLKFVSKELASVVIGFTIGFMAIHVAAFFVLIYTPWLFIWAIAGTILRIIANEKGMALEKLEEKGDDV